MNRSCHIDGIRIVDGMDLFACFTINTNSLQSNQVVALSAILYLHDFHDIQIPYYAPLYSRNIRGSRGARVFIHERDTFPDINKGFDISPGTDVVIDLNMEVVTRLPAPYGQCTEQKYLDDDSKVNRTIMGDQYVKYKYTTGAAISRCHQLRTIKSCGCFHPFLILTPEIFSYHFRTKGIISCYSHLYTFPNLNLTHIADTIDCFQTLSYDGHCNEFLAPCKEKVYSYQYSQTPWPHETYEMAFYDAMISTTSNNRSHKFGSKFSIYDHIRNVTWADRSEGLNLLRNEDLIERNFIQLTARFKVKYIK